MINSARSTGRCGSWSIADRASLKLQAKIPKGEQVRRVYDVAQTPLQRLLASGVLPEDRQRALRERVQQIDPLALSEHLDALRHALLYGAHLPLWFLPTGVPGHSSAPWRPVRPSRYRRPRKNLSRQTTRRRLRAVRIF